MLRSQTIPSLISTVLLVSHQTEPALMELTMFQDHVSPAQQDVLNVAQMELALLNVTTTVPTALVMLPFKTASTV